jgi:hypothetical protein
LPFPRLREVKKSSLPAASIRWSAPGHVVVLGLVFVLAACQAATSTTTPSHAANSTVGAVPTDRPSAAPSPSARWERVTVQIGFEAPLGSVVWTGTQFLATGDGSLFSSTDGRTWQQQPQLPGGSVDQVTVGPQGLLATGSVNAEGVVAIWHSGDGLAWTRTPDAVSLHGRDGAFLAIAGIVPAGAGWLAVGAERVNCVPHACGLVRAVAWTSPDGLAWTRSPDEAGLRHAAMTGVVRTASGFVAVGAAAADPSRADSLIQPAVWTSPDGRAWTRSNGLPKVHAPQDADVMLDAVAITGSQVVAVGHVSTPDAVFSDAIAWWSDGGTWSSVQIGRFFQSQPIRVVAVAGGMLAILGTSSGTGCTSGMWTSADGSAWDCLHDDAAFADSSVFDAAMSSKATVLVGSGGEGALAWVSAPR